jgi:lactate dehydrogenase-like 2-hydroxyacid dehydrogenase
MNESTWPIRVVICGCARGADEHGRTWANKHGIKVENFPANWAKYGKSAGYRRNQEMAAKADGVIAIWDGHSKGTNHMINIAKEKGLKVQVFIFGE